jgi:hypothetical protein
MGLNWSQINDDTYETEFPNEYQERQKLFNFWKNNKQELKNNGFLIKKDDEDKWKIIYNNNDLNIEEACSKWKESFDDFNEDNVEIKTRYFQNQENQEKLEIMIKKIIQDEISDLKSSIYNELNDIKELLKQKKKRQ